MTRIDKIRNEYIRETAEVERFGGKVRETKLRCTEDLDDRAARQEEKKKTTEKSRGCSKIGDGEGWCDKENARNRVKWIINK